jgi:rubrerythrin
MLGISRKTLNKRIGEEQQAQSDYGKNIAEAKRKKDPKSAKVIGHIRGEEREHESMLRKLGA